MKLASSSPAPPSGGRSMTISVRESGMPMTVSRNSPSRNVRPSTSKPSSTKNADTASRSATVMPTWSKRRIRDMRCTLSCSFAVSSAATGHCSRSDFRLVAAGYDATITCSIPSWEDVHEKLTRLQADTMSGKRIATTSQTVGEYLTYWLAEHARHRVRATTYRRYEQLVRLYLIPLFGNKKLARLRPGDIRRGLLKLKQTCQCCAQGKDQAREDRANALRAKRAGMAPRKNGRPIDGARCCVRQPRECCRSVVSDGTIRYLHRLLRAALQDAVNEDELLTENVAKRLRM